MRRVFKQHLISILLTVAAVLAVAELAWWLVGRAHEDKAERRLEAQRRELSALQRFEPAPTPDAAARLEQQVTQAAEKLAALERAWFAGKTITAWQKLKVPGDRRAAYFDLANYRQRMATLAQREQVSLAKDEAFGFAAYVNEGPDEADLARVFRQRLVLEELLGALLRAHPTSLAGVAVEAAMSADDGRRTRGANAVEPLPEMLSLRRDGMIATQVLEFRFTGRTAVLRDWLNRLAVSDLPVAVRNVMVQPSAAAPVRAPAGVPGVVLDATGDGFEPLVKPTDSAFTVTLEYLELVKPDAGAEDES